MKVVTVDDGPDEVRIFNRVFHSEDGGWSHFSDYDDVERAIIAGELDDAELILLDMKLDEDQVAGLRLAAVLGSREPRGSIVVLSASQVQDVICECFRAGASAYIVKPADEGELELVVSALKTAGPHTRRCLATAQ